MHLSHERHQFLRWWDVITHTETCIHMYVALKLLCIIELAHAMRNWCQFLKCRQPNTQTRDTLLQLNYNVNDFSNASIDKYWNRICSVCVCVWKERYDSWCAHCGLNLSAYKRSKCLRRILWMFNFDAMPVSIEQRLKSRIEKNFLTHQIRFRREHDWPNITFFSSLCFSALNLLLLAPKM